MIDRRTLLQSAAAAGFAAATAPLPAAAGEKWRWAFLYWMPYDNDLAGFRDEVLDEMRRGLPAEGVLVAVQADTPRAGGMQRLVVTGGKLRTEPVAGTDSSSGEELAQFLEWAAARFPAENYAVVVLGHGGRAEELSVDRSSEGWMRLDALAAALQRLQQASGGARPALLYLQVCSKGTIETFYALRETAHVTLAAQSLLGVPNYYYAPLLRSLHRDNVATPMEVAKRIVAAERPDMFTSLVGMNNFALPELPQRLKPLLEAVRGTGVRTLDRGDVTLYEYPVGSGEVHADFIRLLAALSTRFDAVRPHYMAFSTWLWNAMGARRTDGSMPDPTRRDIGQDLYGIGILLPQSREQWDRYRALPFHAATRFWDYVPYRIAQT